VPQAPGVQESRAAAHRAQLQAGRVTAPVASAPLQRTRRGRVMRWKSPSSCWAVLLGLSLWVGCSSVGSAAEPTSSEWRSIASAACAHWGCEARLLIAIGLWESDARGNDTFHDDQRSYGRYGMTIGTAAYHLLGPRFSHPRNLRARIALWIGSLLVDEVQGADVAARELARCSRKGRGRVRILRCWNPGPDYPAHVLRKYREIAR
jgi:hypothetical protein